MIVPEYLVYLIPLISAFIFTFIKYLFFNDDDNNFSDALVEFSLLIIINYVSFFFIYQNLGIKQDIKQLKNNIEPIITGPPKFFPYQQL